MSSQMDFLSWIGARNLFHTEDRAWPKQRGSNEHGPNRGGRMTSSETGGVDTQLVRIKLRYIRQTNQKCWNLNSGGKNCEHEVHKSSQAIEPGHK